MSLSVVSAQLKQWADSAALRASQANDPDSIHALQQAANQFRKLMEAVQGGATELQAAQRRLAEVPAPVAPTVRRKAGMGAFAFWRLHGQAVDAIVAEYGLEWKTRAPFGDTVLATVQPGYRSAKGGRGSEIHWTKDHRMPSARFWPDQKLPSGLDVSPDYERHVSGVTRLHDAAWHRSRGYVWHGGAWVHEIEVRNAQNYADASLAYNVAKRLAGLAQAATWYGPQPLADVEGHLMAAE